MQDPPSIPEHGTRGDTKRHDLSRIVGESGVPRETVIFKKFRPMGRKSQRDRCNTGVGGCGQFLRCALPNGGANSARGTAEPMLGRSTPEPRQAFDLIDRHVAYSCERPPCRGPVGGDAVSAIVLSREQPGLPSRPGGKEEIAEAALALGAEGVRRAIAQAAETSQSAEEFLLRIARGMASDLERSDFKEGCPIAPTALEVTSQSPLLVAATSNGFRTWEREIARGLERFAMAPQDAELVATTALSQLEGALLLARTYHDLEPMRRAEKAMTLLLGRPR